MFNTKEAMKLYAVTDRRWSKDQNFSDHVQDAINGGITCLQLREKNLDQDTFIQEALVMKALCKDIPLIINDNIEVTIKSNADGIHIGQHDQSLIETRKLLGPDKIIGVSTQQLNKHY